MEPFSPPLSRYFVTRVTVLTNDHRMSLLPYRNDQQNSPADYYDMVLNSRAALASRQVSESCSMPQLTEFPQFKYSSSSIGGSGLYKFKLDSDIRACDSSDAACT